MAGKKKSKGFSVVKAVKSAAREQVGAPRATRAVPDAKTKAKQRANKHKRSLGELMTENESD